MALYEDAMGITSLVDSEKLHLQADTMRRFSYLCALSAALSIIPIYPRNFDHLLFLVVKGKSL